MLGEVLGEERGKVTAFRVLPSDGHGSKVEVSAQASGKVLGLDAGSRVTYLSIARLDGTLYGEGQGIITTSEGDRATFTGAGVGKLTGAGSVSWRGALYYQTASERLERLNGVAGVFEFEVDQEGNTHAKVWEWK